MKKVNVTTLKQLNKDINEIYDEIHDSFVNDSDFRNEIIDDLNLTIKIIDKEYSGKDEDGCDLYDYSVDCSECGNTLFPCDEEGSFCDCGSKDGGIVVQLRNEPDKDFIRKVEVNPLYLQWKTYSPSASYVSFLYPIVSQDDLLVLAQFNIIVYLDENSDVKYQAIMSGSDDLPLLRNVLIFSSKFNFRVINENNGAILLAHNSTNEIQDCFTVYDNEVNCGLSTAFSKSIIAKSNTIDKNILNLINKHFDNVEDGILDQSVLFDKFFSYIPKKNKKNMGVNRYLPTLYNNKEDIYQKIKEDISSKRRVLTRLLDEPSETIEKEVDGVIFNRSYQKAVSLCPHCNHVNDIVMYKDEMEGFRNQRYKISEDTFCRECGCILDAEEINSLYWGEYYSVLVYDKDQKNRLIERSFSYHISTHLKEDLEFEESISEVSRAIFVSNNSNPIVYKKNSRDGFDRVESYSATARSLYDGRIVLMQTKKEIQDIIQSTDLKYSGFEDLLFSKEIGVDSDSFSLYYSPIFITSEYSYIKKWIQYPSLEKLARVPEYHHVLTELMHSNDRLLEIINPNGSNIQDTFFLNDFQYQVFKNQEKSLNNLSNIKMITRRLSIDSVELYNDLSSFCKNIATVNYISDILDNVDISLKSIVNYINRVKRYQRIPEPYAMSLWRDYIRISLELGRNLNDKNLLYPSSLKREHDIVSDDHANIINGQSGELTKQEKQTFEKLKRFEYNEDDSFVVIAPVNKKEVVEEGNKLNHCVASYANDVAKGKTNILFMRSKEDISKPLYTIEIDNKDRIVQVRGYSNSDFNNVKEFVFFNKFKKELNLI